MSLSTRPSHSPLSAAIDWRHGSWSHKTRLLLSSFLAGEGAAFGLIWGILTGAYLRRGQSEEADGAMRARPPPSPATPNPTHPHGCPTLTTSRLPLDTTPSALDPARGGTGTRADPFHGRSPRLWATLPWLAGVPFTAPQARQWPTSAVNSVAAADLA
jgi:hypothetical protein